MLFSQVCYRLLFAKSNISKTRAERSLSKQKKPGWCEYVSVRDVNNIFTSGQKSVSVVGCRNEKMNFSVDDISVQRKSYTKMYYWEVCGVPLLCRLLVLRLLLLYIIRYILSVIRLTKNKIVYCLHKSHSTQHLWSSHTQKLSSLIFNFFCLLTNSFSIFFTFFFFAFHTSHLHASVMQILVAGNAPSANI